MRGLSCGRAWVVAGVLAAWGASTGWALEVGDPAPPIEVKEWVSNTPVTVQSAKGKVLVVEFWATWCGPCKVTIPHLNKLQAKYRDREVLFVSISNEPAAKVKEFLKTTPMHYHVGIAASEGAYRAYMAGVRGIPHAFVVDRAGKVAWSGHPMMGMDGVVKKLVAGTFDPAKARKLDELNKKLRAARSFPAAYAVLDEMIEAVPDDPGAYRRKRGLLGRQGKHAEAHALLLAMAKACAADAGVLGEVAAELCATGDLQRRDLAKALELAAKAVELTKGDDAEALAALARTHYELGHLAKAVELADKAAAAAAGDDAATLKAHASFYRAELARRRQDPDAKL